jgi:DNA-binding beta-propeller fold protein YncE
MRLIGQSCLPVRRALAIFAVFVAAVALPRRVQSAHAAAASPAPEIAETRAWRVSTFAGTGEAGDSGDGGPATAAKLNNPFGITRGPDGALYVCDAANHRVRRIDRNGTITTVAGSGRRGYSGDGGPATKAELNEPYEVRCDAAGNLYFVEMQNHLVRKVDRATGVISTVAGTGKAGFSGDGGPATRAQFSSPHAIQFDPEKQSLYVCDIGNHRVRRIDLKSGTITTFAGAGETKPTPDGADVRIAPLHGPRAIDFDAAGDLWLALREGNRVYRVEMKSDTVRHVAGTGKTGFTGDGGPAKSATLSGPKGIAVGPDGNVYLADTESDTIRVIDVKRGTIERIAGTGEKGDGPDGPARSCRFNRPHGIFVDADGTVFVGDTENHRVRAIKPASAGKVPALPPQAPPPARSSPGR